jgi:predicted O-methyltransferase YrrM
LPIVVLDNAFWPAAVGMPPIIGSRNKAKAVSMFIDILYSLSRKRRYGEY